MSNEKMDTSSLKNQKSQEKREGCENVPPAPLLDESCTSSSYQNAKGKPRLSGLQSALSPILKYLNIGNKNTSLSNVFNSPTKPNASVSVLSVENNKDSYACPLMKEYFSDITLLDVTCNSPIDLTNAPCNTEPSTSGFSKELKRPVKVLDLNLNSWLCPAMSPFPWLHHEVLPEISPLDDTCDMPESLTKHDSILLENVPRFSFSITGTPANSSENNNIDKPNSPLSSDTNSSSLAPENKAPSLVTTYDCTSHSRPLESSEILSAKTLKLEISQSSLETMSTTFTGNLTYALCSASGKSDGIVEDVKNPRVTQDISVTSTFDCSKQKIEETQPVTEAHPINITRDLSTSNASVRCDVSQSSISNCNNATCELDDDPGKTSRWKKLSCVSDTVSGTENMPNTAVSLNNTFTTIHDNVALQPSTLQNRTIEFSNSQSGPLMPENQNTNASTKQVSPESSIVLNDNCSQSKYSQRDEIQNQTSEKNSLQKSHGSTIVGPASATSVSLQNTFEIKPNGTTCEEKTTSDDKSQDLHDRSSSNPVNNEISAKPKSPEKLDEMIQVTAVSDHKLAEPQERTFDVNVATEEKAASRSSELKDLLNKEHSLCDSIINHNIEEHKANGFSLDRTLDFKSNPLVTSTPMSTIKSSSFTAEKEECKTTAPQKRLHKEGPRKPVAPVSIQVPSKRSTAAAASALKPSTSGLQKAATSGVPSGNQRTGLGLKPPQAKSISAVSSGADKSAGGTIPLAKNTLPAKKHPMPKTDALTAAKKKKIDNQLKASKAEAPASFSGTVSKAKTLKAPTHIQRTLPPKPLKPDSSVPSTSADSNAACGSTSRVRTLRPPVSRLKALSTKPQCHDCSKRTWLEAQLKLKDEEIRHLKEELRRLNKLE